MKTRFLLLIAAVIFSAASALTQQQWKFEITTYDANRTFYIPVSGGNGGKAYNWNINWGDGSQNETVSGIGSLEHEGIPHIYANAGTYEITITPAESNDAWLAAFGFSLGYVGANAQSNKWLVTKVISAITPLMTRTQSEITSNTTTPPDYEWYNTFWDVKILQWDLNLIFQMIGTQ